MESGTMVVKEVDGEEGSGEHEAREGVTDGDGTDGKKFTCPLCA